MEIRDTRTPPQPVAFSTLKPGDVFMSGANMFLRMGVRANCNSNAVVLVDGRQTHFEMFEPVTPCSAYVVKES